MTLTAGSDYQRFCAAFIEDALLRPRMYFRDLVALENMLHGHAVGFYQLESVATRAAMFNTAFAAWLAADAGVSVSSGWARAIERLAAKRGVKSETLFADSVRRFLKCWATA